MKREWKMKEFLPSQANSNAGMDELCSTVLECHYSFMAMYYVQYFGAFWAGLLMITTKLIGF